MDNQKKSPCRKKEYQKISFDLKLSIIDQIKNGQISVNHAAKVHQISRSSIMYWMKKLGSFEQNNKAMNKNEENKKLKEKIDELEFIKELLQDIVADLEVTTGQTLAKKCLPETLAKEIEKKKRNLTK